MTTVGESQAKVILHLDMNSFFASVEQAHDPSLKGIPMAVAGNPKARKGILVTCSYEARALGIYTTMTVGEAKRLCPDLVIVPPDFENIESLRLRFSICYEPLQTLWNRCQLMRRISILLQLAD